MKVLCVIEAHEIILKIDLQLMITITFIYFGQLPSSSSIIAMATCKN